jgi:hypothetical protein
MATQVRKLAAIMFTDIVGYTALMGADEKKAFDMLRKKPSDPLAVDKKISWKIAEGDG